MGQGYYVVRWANIGRIFHIFTRIVRIWEFILFMLTNSLTTLTDWGRCLYKTGHIIWWAGWLTDSLLTHSPQAVRLNCNQPFTGLRWGVLGLVEDSGRKTETSTIMQDMLLYKLFRRSVFDIFQITHLSCNDNSERRGGIPLSCLGLSLSASSGLSSQY